MPYSGVRLVVVATVRIVPLLDAGDTTHVG
jgi:hypothetical protein